MLKTKNHWTDADEQAYQELTATRERIRGVQVQRLDEVIARLVWRSGDAASKRNAMIAHAGDLRDALAPFDGGIREGQLP